MQETRNEMFWVKKKCNTTLRTYVALILWHSCLSTSALQSIVLIFSTRNNCCELLASDSGILQSVHKLYSKNTNLWLFLLHGVGCFRHIDRILKQIMEGNSGPLPNTKVYFHFKFNINCFKYFIRFPQVYLKYEDVGLLEQIR